MSVQINLTTTPNEEVRGSHPPSHKENLFLYDWQEEASYCRSPYEGLWGAVPIRTAKRCLV